MTLILMTMLVFGGGIAAYGGVLIGVTVLPWGVGKAMRQQNQHMRDASRVLRKGAQALLLGSAVLAVAAFSLHYLDAL